MLHAALASRLGPFELELELTVPAGDPVVVVGENGAGKTTLLRVLAGLVAPDRGRIELDGEVLEDVERGVHVPPAERRVGFVAQGDSLFPHLSVQDNVAFGPRASGERGVALRARVERALEEFGLTRFAGRSPDQLSGGERQRVALARALVLEPRLLLLDEPLAAVDIAARQGLRAELRRRLAGRGCVTLLVTHDPFEALALGERLVVLERGRVAQEGSRDELLKHPRSRLVAEMLGVNLLRGVLRRYGTGSPAQLETADGTIVVTTDVLDGMGTGEEVFAVVSPREITLSREVPIGSAQNVLRGPIAEMVPEPSGLERLRVSLATRPPLVAEITRHAAATLGLVPGEQVVATFKATGVTVFR